MRCGPSVQELMAGGTLKALLVDAYYSMFGRRLFSRQVRATSLPDRPTVGPTPLVGAQIHHNERGTEVNRATFIAHSCTAVCIWFPTTALQPLQEFSSHLQDAMRWVLQIAEALAYLHHFSPLIVHRVCTCSLGQDAVCNCRKRFAFYGVLLTVDQSLHPFRSVLSKALRLKSALRLLSDLKRES